MKKLAMHGALVTVAAVLAVAAPGHAQDDAYEYDYYENDYYEDEPRYYGEQTELWGEELEDLEYEPGEGLHEEEWYDPSDWIDFDEGIEYEYDDYDYEYGYYDDAYADDDWFYDYYDYGYDYLY